ncbi:MAG: carboxylate-amine ligase [Alphaproteobacteria bacterium]|nr:carboxylate-amine ligase [Alphaproteobacteria bacterium]
MTSLKEPTFTVGIEEEYLLVDRETRDLASDPPAEVLRDCEKVLEGQVTPEFLRSQIEVGTRVCGSIKEAAEDLKRLRRTIIDVADNYGLGMIAASTHPMADWGEQKHTDKDRYNILARDLQAVARRLLICGMHVHVGIEDNDLRIDLMNQVTYVLPHILALSTSSPFWRGDKTGLMSYRIAVWDELPRTGLPERFDGWEHYQRFVDMMCRSGVIEDATKLWWDVRPSARFPTLEMRVSDICTRVEDTICIAAIYMCWLSMLYRLRRRNQRWRIYSPLLIRENRWRAQRYGHAEGLVDFGLGQVVPYSGLLDEIFDLIGEDAERLDCVEEIRHARKIVEDGTSAHRQIAAFDQACADGASHREGLMAVVDMLIEDTKVGL